MRHARFLDRGVDITDSPDAAKDANQIMVWEGDNLIACLTMCNRGKWSLPGDDRSHRHSRRDALRVVRELLEAS